MMIKKSISRQLKDKIIQDMEVKVPVDGFKDFGEHNYIGYLFFTSDEMHLRDECREWLEVINVYFLSSYNACRINKIGTLRGVRPKHVFYNNATFTINNQERENWKDWFIQDDADLKFIKE